MSRSQILDYSASLNSEFMNEIVNVLGEETDDRRTDSGQAWVALEIFDERVEVRQDHLIIH